MLLESDKYVCIKRKHGVSSRIGSLTLLGITDFFD